MWRWVQESLGVILQDQITFLIKVILQIFDDWKFPFQDLVLYIVQILDFLTIQQLLWMPRQWSYNLGG